MHKSDEYYQAMLSRDRRFDGRFFVGVKTTGIYCRSICPAKKPKKENVEFFASAISAEAAGFRPCLRCRPESAPFSAAWIGRSSIIQRALKLISRNGFVDQTEETFSDQLGVTARHLRRLFQMELGASPKQISDLNRLNLAKKFILETQLSFTEIGFASGFKSIRQFNEAFKARFNYPPSYFRSKLALSEDKRKAPVELTLAYRPPFDWDFLLNFYKTHAIFGVETVDTESYSRIFNFGDGLGAFSICNNEQNSKVHLKIALSDVRYLNTIVQKIRHMFDLDCDPLAINRHFEGNVLLSKLLSKYPGLRLPKGWNSYETSVCAILGQLVSTEQASRLVKQLVEGYGQVTQNPLNGTKCYLFPEAKILANESLSRVGTTQARKATLREFSRLVLDERIDLDGIVTTEEIRRTLLGIKGIGPWTADYICLRAIGDTDTFPSTDLILKRVLEHNPDLNLDLVKPWRSYAATLLWTEFAKQLSKKKVSPLQRSKALEREKLV